MPARKIDELLARSGELRALSIQARRLAELQQVLHEAVPSSLVHSARVSTFRAGRLVVLADNAAVAAKLKQLAPRLLRHLQERGNQVTGIQVDVQVAAPQRASNTASSERDLSLTALRSLEGLAGTMKESPLKGALDRMVQRRKRATRGSS
ncbi:MAG TPA: DUF721 domain-containing protein [Burkholderiales bacterium]|nr:DUF721 domain-containing protein [Burkholderiales bacterium]